MIAVSVAKFMESFVQIGPPLREEIGYILSYIHYDHYSKEGDDACFSSCVVNLADLFSLHWHAFIPS